MMQESGDREFATKNNTSAQLFPKWKQLQHKETEEMKRFTDTKQEILLNFDTEIQNFIKAAECQISRLYYDALIKRRHAKYVQEKLEKKRIRFEDDPSDLSKEHLKDARLLAKVWREKAREVKKKYEFVYKKYEFLLNRIKNVEKIDETELDLKRFFSF